MTAHQATVDWTTRSSRKISIHVLGYWSGLNVVTPIDVYNGSGFNEITSIEVYKVLGLGLGFHG